MTTQDAVSRSQDPAPIFLLLTCTRSFDAADPAGVEWACEWYFESDGTADSLDPRAEAEVVSGWHLTFADVP